MPRSTNGIRVAIAALVALGLGLTLLAFYPGVMTYDAKYVYLDIAKGFYGDWQSPVMTWLWKWIDPVAPGSASMFLLIAVSYWLAFGVLALAVAPRSVRLAVLLPILALLPPAFVFVGIIWRDVLFGVTWLLAGAVAYGAAERTARLRISLQAVALVLCAFGVLLRPNALIAAALLAAYIVWPTRFSWKRTAVLAVPAMAAFFALVQVVYYGALGATRQHPLQSVMVFDLGGISHFAQENQFPVNFNAPATAMLLNTCYRPTEWDIFWRLEPCHFVMDKLEKEQKLFGTPAVPAAWLRALAHHPLAYLEHRSAFMWNFLAGANLTMWTADIEKPDTTVFPERSAFGAVKSVHDWLKPTPLFRAGAWLIVCLVVCAIGWARRETPGGAFAIGVAGSAALYVLTFFAVGVASDFRYAYWAVLAGIAGSVVAALGPAKPPPA